MGLGCAVLPSRAIGQHARLAWYRPERDGSLGSDRQLLLASCLKPDAVPWHVLAFQLRSDDEQTRQHVRSALTELANGLEARHGSTNSKTRESNLGNRCLWVRVCM